MALATFNFESVYLHGNTEISVILPDRPRSVDANVFYMQNTKYRVLWLLHGTFGDNTDWMRKSMIEQYACEKNLIVVMPSALNSSYANWDKSMKKYSMYDYFLDELMPLIFNWFPASDKREDNFIAGLSMGAEGALKFALNHPERFAGVAALSSPPRDYRTLLEGKEQDWNDVMVNRIENAGGYDSFINSIENNWDTLFNIKDRSILPKMYFTCGDKDRSFATYANFAARAQTEGVDAIFEVYKGYRHEWRFWDLTIQKALTHFGLYDDQPAGNAY